jgi:DNA primase
MLHRFPTGVSGEKVHQKRLPRGAPDWVRTVRVTSPAGPHADELCVQHPADVVWAGADVHRRVPPLELPAAHVRAARRVAHRPRPDAGATYADVRRVAHVAHEVLDELGATGWPKTSGGKGMHVYVRIAPEHGFSDVRRAAHAFAREVGRRCDLVDLTWWRKDRDPASVFVDYNQNARDHTIRSAYSVRGVAEAVVSAPIRWDEIDAAAPTTSPSPPCRAASPSSATCTPESTTRSSDRRAAPVGRSRRPERRGGAARGRRAGPRRPLTGNSRVPGAAPGLPWTRARAAISPPRPQRGRGGRLTRG